MIILFQHILMKHSRRMLLMNMYNYHNIHHLKWQLTYTTKGQLIVRSVGHDASL